MRLTVKVVIIIVVTVSTIISAYFYMLMQRFDSQVQEDLLMTARSVYQNILTVRRWVSKYEGTFVLKKPGDQSNPFLPHPDILTNSGVTLTLKNPATVTRELSELNNELGNNFVFHMASRRYLNPVNKPDLFEEKALVFFADSDSLSHKKEFYSIEKIESASYFRYFAPLYTEQSCLSCHKNHGYDEGDLRGGISVLISMDHYEKSKIANTNFFIFSSLLTIGFLSIIIFSAIQRSVIKPLKQIENSTHKIQSGDFDFKLKLNQKDEIGSLGKSFERMREEIQVYTQKIKLSEIKYRNLIEHSAEAMIIVSSDDKIIECNKKLLHLSGFQDLKNIQFHQLIKKCTNKNIGSRSRTEKEEYYEGKLLTIEKIEVPVEIYSIKGFTLGVNENVSFVYVRDLSERKKLEEYALQMEKMFALGQLSSGIAHEIRNPLFALNNNIQFLNGYYGHQDKFKEIYPDMIDGIKRIQTIVSEILDYSKSHPPKFIYIAVTEIVNKCLKIVRKQFEKSAITINTIFNTQNDKIMADAHQVEQVIINLLINAFQAMDRAGILTVKIDSIKNAVQLEISDTGVGIPTEELKRVFDPFYTKFPNGTGLGLAIVQRILDAHYAKYSIHSKVGLGTSFVIDFPQNKADLENEI